MKRNATRPTIENLKHSIYTLKLTLASVTDKDYIRNSIRNLRYVCPLKDRKLLWDTYLIYVQYDQAKDLMQDNLEKTVKRLQEMIGRKHKDNIKNKA
jgi:hypothetical protein